MWQGPQAGLEPSGLNVQEMCSLSASVIRSGSIWHDSWSPSFWKHAFMLCTHFFHWCVSGWHFQDRSVLIPWSFIGGFQNIQKSSFRTGGHASRTVKNLQITTDCLISLIFYGPVLGSANSHPCCFSCKKSEANLQRVDPYPGTLPWNMFSLWGR